MAQDELTAHVLRVQTETNSEENPILLPVWPCRICPARLAGRLSVRAPALIPYRRATPDLASRPTVQCQAVLLDLLWEIVSWRTIGSSLVTPAWCLIAVAWYSSTVVQQVPGVGYRPVGRAPIASLRRAASLLQG